MTKAEFIGKVQGAVSDMSKKEASQVVDAVFEAVAEAITKEKRFSFPGFGTFTVKHRPERQGRNPKDNSTITIKASNTVAFKPAPALKEKL